MEAASFPSLNPLTSAWVPVKEKAGFTSFAYVGGTFGTIITYPLCGLILDNIGWEVRENKRNDYLRNILIPGQHIYGWEVRKNTRNG